MRLSVVVLFFLSLGLNAYAQNKSVKGTVTDEQGEPLIGVSVTVVGNQNIGTATDENGNYSIQMPPKSSVLKFSYIGYKTQMINVATGQTKVNVSLQSDDIMLDQTVVTAMGIRRDEKSMATSYQKVDTETMTEARDQNFLDMLSGKIAGLQVISNGPAGSASVVIRGANSLSGSNDPLYVIDGVPIMSAADVNESTLDYGSPASSINPDDIAELVVLKGANASALYGSQASNGAIIITTKKASGRKGLGVSYSSNLQFTHLSEYPIYQNVYGTGEGGLSIKKAAFNWRSNTEMPFDINQKYGIPRLGGLNQRSWGIPMTGFDVIGRNGELKQYSPANSLIDLYSTAHSWTNSVSVEKASEFASVRFSYSNMTSDDIMMKQNEIVRNTMNLQANMKPAKFLNIDFGVRYTSEDAKNRNSRNSSKANPLYSAAWMPRDLSIAEMTPWKTEDGHLAGNVNKGGFVNPMWTLNETSNEDKKDWLLADATVHFQISKELKLRLKGSIDYNAGQGYTFVNMYDPTDISKGDGEYFEFSERSKRMMYEALLSYNKRWKTINLSANIGANSQDQNRKKQNSRIETLLIPGMKSLDNNGATARIWQEYDNKKKQAVFGTASIGYRDLVYLDLTGRNDWTSTLPSDARSYFYYSVGSSFILTEAVKSIPSSILSFAKFRASYAQVGNDTGFDQLRNGLRYGSLFMGDMPWYQSDTRKKNPNLKPESTTSIETGADLKFWSNRIGLNLTYYSESTKNQILNSQVSYISGYTSAVVNAGEVRNRGVELSLNVIPVKLKDFQWEAVLNWSQNKSKAVDLADGMDAMTLAQSEGIVQFKIVKGRSLGTLYAKMAMRDAQGHVLVDEKGRAKNEADQFLADISPKYMGGLRNTFRFKGITASILLDFRKGGKLWSATAHQGTRDGQTITSLEGRDGYLFSKMVLGESDEERRGFQKTEFVNNPNATNNANGTTGVLVPYADGDRPKGLLTPNGVFDSKVGLLAGQNTNAWVNPSDYWMNTDANAHYYLYDASFIKLRELSVGYDLPKKVLSKMLGGFIQTAKISFVGRNLAILHRNTPKGIDPEASSSLGIVQGFEKGFSLPSSTYGFDIKITF
jgi:TonB-linked SusC/RagA family outer membrane protein